MSILWKSELINYGTGQLNPKLPHVWNKRALTKWVLWPQVSNSLLQSKSKSMNSYRWVGSEGTAVKHSAWHALNAFVLWKRILTGTGFAHRLSFSLHSNECSMLAELHPTVRITLQDRSRCSLLSHACSLFVMWAGLNRSVCKLWLRWRRGKNMHQFNSLMGCSRYILKDFFSHFEINVTNEPCKNNPLYWS